jgi:nitrite reductase/ring-hydroxylating ferredoxin subunit
MTTTAMHACKTSEVAPGQQKIVTLGNRAIGIFEIDGYYFALLNVCPHRGGQLCEGPQCGTSVDTGEYRMAYGRRNELVRCAWHGWEFDIRTGTALTDSRVRAKAFAVSVDGDDIYVHV